MSELTTTKGKYQMNCYPEEAKIQPDPICVPHIAVYDEIRVFVFSLARPYPTMSCENEDNCERKDTCAFIGQFKPKSKKETIELEVGGIYEVKGKIREIVGIGETIVTYIDDHSKGHMCKIESFKRWLRG